MKPIIPLLGALTIALPGAVSAEVQKAEMAGYLLVSADKVPDEFNAGFSLYTAAWPLLERYPGHRFQTGLFGTWMHAQYEGKAPKAGWAGGATRGSRRRRRSSSWEAWR
jgi:hypothetical protein